MPKLIRVLTLVLILTTPALVGAATDCAELLGPMTGIMQSVRLGATLSPVEQQTWRAWNAMCTDPAWQQALREGLPATIPPVPANLIPPTTPPQDIPSLTWRDYALAALKGFEQGLNAPITTCRTTRAQRGNRVGYYTTCNTYGGY